MEKLYSMLQEIRAINDAYGISNDKIDKLEEEIKTDESLVYMLEEMFEDVKPVINTRMGGSEYQNELVEVLQDICNIKAKQ